MRKSKKLLVALLSVSFAFAAVGAVATTATTSSQRYVSAAAEETAAYNEVAVNGEALSIYETDTDNGFLYIKIAGSDWAKAPGNYSFKSDTEVSKRLEDLKTFAFLGKDLAMNNLDPYFNLWTRSDVLVFKYQNKTDITIPKGTKFPSYAYASTGTGDVYVLSDDVQFTRKSADETTWNKEILIERENVSINDVFSVRASTVTTSDSKIYTIDADSNFFIEGGEAGTWLMDHYTDVQNYILVNGKSVAEINKDTDDSSYKYEVFPGTLGDVYAVPIRVNIGSENGKTRLNVYIHNEYLKTNSVASIGLKAGFSTKDDKNIYQVTEDRVFYAHDGKYLRQCSVTFDGGEAKTAYIGATLPADILPATPSKDATETIAYTFDGWYVEDKKFDVEKDVVTGDMALVAKFTESARKYSVTYNKEDGTEYQTVEVANGETLTLIQVPEKLGYTGVWSGETFDKMPTKDIVYTASYTAIEYAVTFKADGETVGTETYTVEDKTITEPSVPEKTGYTGKWETYELTTGDVTVNAVYTAIEYKVTFKADGQTVGTDTYTVEDKTITEPSVPEKTGYTGVWETYELTTGDVTVNAVYTAIPQEPSSEPTESGSDETSVTSENTSESGSDETPVTSENTSGSEEKDKGGCGSVASVLGVSGALALAGVVTALKKKKEE